MYPIYPIVINTICLNAVFINVCVEIFVVIDADTIINKPMIHKKTMAICICIFLPFGSLREILNFFILFIVSNNCLLNIVEPKLFYRLTISRM